MNLAQQLKSIWNSKGDSQCKLCKKKFKNALGLKRHRLIKHGGKV